MMQRQPPRGETSFLIYTPLDFYYKTELTANMNGWSYDKLKLYRFQQAIANKESNLHNLRGKEHLFRYRLYTPSKCCFSL